MAEDDLGTTGTGTSMATETATVATGGSATTSDIPTTAPADDGPVSMTEDSSTGEDASTSSTGPENTTGESICGDGVVGGAEECDDGLDGNDDSHFCKADCTLNVCGDGKLFVDWELCDEGAANSDAYGSLCGAQCEPGPRCGDHKLQAEFETCDLGADNGGKKGDEQGILCDEVCRAQRLRGFVTQDSFNGNLGGLPGADLKCQNAAKAAGLAEPERFHAYLSTGTVDAKERFKTVAASLPFVLVTGKKFADNFLALITNGPLGEGIASTEYGIPLYKADVATNTAPGGLTFSSSEDCQDWSSADAAYSARLGLNAMPVNSPDAMIWKDELWWTGVKSLHCNKEVFRLYCLEI